MDLYGFEEAAPTPAAAGSSGSRLGLLRKSGTGGLAGKGGKFQAKALTRRIEADALPVAIEARTATSDASRGKPLTRGARPPRAGGRPFHDGVKQDSLKSDSKSYAGGAAGSLIARPVASARTAPAVADVTEGEAPQVGDAAPESEYFALGGPEIEEDEPEDAFAEPFPQAAVDEDDSWPPRIDSDLRPVTLPYRLGAPLHAASITTAGEAGVYGSLFTPEVSGADTRRPRKRQVFASQDVAAAVGYGMSSAAHVDAAPQQCAHVFVDASRIVEHKEIESRGETDYEWPADEGYIPVNNGRLVHMVLPSSLPCIGHAATAPIAKPSTSDQNGITPDPSETYRTKMKAVPSGTIGQVSNLIHRCTNCVAGNGPYTALVMQLAILKSGQVKMKIGDVLFDVNAGIPRSMYEQLVAVLPADSHAADLKKTDAYKYCVQAGQISATLTVTPNIDRMLSVGQTPAVETNTNTAYRDLVAELGHHTKPKGAARQRSSSQISINEAETDGTAK